MSRLCRFVSLLLVCGLLLPLTHAAGAAYEGDITSQCRITMPANSKSRKAVFDRQYYTKWARYGERETLIEISLPEGVQAGGLYLCFAIEPEELWLYKADQEEPLHHSLGAGYAHRYLPFEGAQRLTLKLKGGREGFSLSELFVVTGREPPAWVQRWEPVHAQADLLVLVAHPDDELLWMGGAIPRYSQSKDVTVAYMTCANPLRRSEMLNGLWAAGVRHYPVIGSFNDKRISSLSKSWAFWGGEEKVLGYVTGLLRQLKPSVVLTHDLKGEYGHPAHIITATALTQALEAAGDASRFPDSAALHGTWQVPKAYLHLWQEAPLTMDWHRPVAGSDLSELDTAREAFAQHRSQKSNWRVEVEGPHSAAQFGLYRSLVGDDEAKDDFFENIPPRRQGDKGR